MKKGSKVKFGGGSLSLGAGRINHFSDWGGTGDLVSAREFRKGGRRIKLKALKKINKTNPDFYPTADLAPSLPEIRIGHGPEIHDDYFRDIEHSTGYYRLKYDGETSRKIKFSLNADDLHCVCQDDLGTGSFNVFSNGTRLVESYGPYSFEATTTGKRDFIEIIHSTEDQGLKSDPEMISGSITGYDGANGGYSTQSLVFATPAKTKNINITFSGLNPYSIYETKSAIHYKDINIGRLFSSGTTPTIIKTQSETTGGCPLAYTIPSGMIAAPKVMLAELEASMQPLCSGEMVDIDDEFHIMGWLTGYQRRGKAFEQKPLIATQVYSVDDSYTYDDFWDYDGPKDFSGSYYQTFESIKIQDSNSLERFIIHHDRSSCMNYCENLELINNPNLTQICIPSLYGATGINFSGCNISSYNSGTLFYPDLGPEFLTQKYHTTTVAPITRSFNIAGNDLDVFGMWNVCNQLAEFNSYSGLKPQGYLNIKDQKTYYPTTSGISGIINTLSGRNWIVEYDK